MPFSFPSSPTVGQTSTQNGRSYTYAGSNVWQLTAGTGSGGTVTIPASGDPYWQSVGLLLRMDGASGSTSFTDAGLAPKNITAYGNTAVSTAQSKFGGASAIFDGNGDYLTAPDSGDFDFPGDFTIEAWVYLTGYSGPNDGQYYGATIVSRYKPGGGNPGWLLRINGTSSSYGSINFYTGTSDYSWNNSLSLNTWYHVAVCRSGSSLRAFVDGTQVGSTITNSDNMTKSSADPLFIGAMNDSTYRFWMLGHIDDLRITKAARYAANFTAPSATLPIAAPYQPAQTLTVVYT